MNPFVLLLVNNEKLLLNVAVKRYIMCDRITGSHAGYLIFTTLYI
jgi:hypothetical protein